MMWDVSTFTPVGGDASRFGKPTGSTGGPLLVYCHGVGGDETEFDHPDYLDLRAWMLTNGWAWVEADAGGPAWGNTLQRARYRAAYDHVAAAYAITDVVLFGRSMGGVVASWLYLYDPVIEPVGAGLILCSGVQDLMWMYDSSSSASFAGSIRTAYGTATRAATVAAIAGHNPMDFPAADYTGKSVLWQTGDADLIVSGAENVLERRATATGLALDDADVVAGGDHYATRNRPTVHTAFLSAVAPGGTPVVPELLRVTQAFVEVAGDRYPVNPLPAQ